MILFLKEYLHTQHGARADNLETKSWVLHRLGQPGDLLFVAFL